MIRFEPSGVAEQCSGGKTINFPTSQNYSFIEPANSKLITNGRVIYVRLLIMFDFIRVLKGTKVLQQSSQ